MRALPFLLLLASCAATTTQDAGPRTWRQRFVEPVTAPTTFESPVIDTQVVPILINQSLPDDSAFAGGDLQVLALQLRYAVDDRLAIIATKDGYIDFNPAGAPDEDGMADLAAGVKYAFVDDPEEGLLVTGGVTLELATGDEEVFQGNGDGLLRPFVSVGQDMGSWAFLGSLALSAPLDGDEEVTSYDLHLHADYLLSEDVRPLIEFNMIHYLEDGEAAPFDFEGGDLINLGSTMVSGNTLSTLAGGVRWRVGENVWLGVAHEVSVGREDLLEDRQTIDLVFSF